ncbi:hypothetical protein PCANC_23442 [Puccinia coronata f. sp. avenae]|uniref:Uncharacterized protein n=1 Tax=Puccinia coronata f. sp. avenae TaxID=200324 RepID=A0A2N5S3T0_9BASI|nr:hypothetical protein PCANC_23442 [Puccinia coronata f. sp. avenae]PLW28014.1 hypothetical protein PCASD_19817 [Puccinia coronata f. sp. avenae]
MTDAIPLCYLPPSLEYPAPYHSHLPSTALSEFVNRGQTPNRSDGSSHLSVKEAEGLSPAPLANGLYTTDVISNSTDSSPATSITSPSHRPLECIAVAPLPVSLGGSYEIPSHLGSPVALTDPEGLVARLSFPLLHSSPIQETFDLPSERPLAHNRRSRWLSTNPRPSAPQELGRELPIQESVAPIMPRLKGHQCTNSTTSTTGSRLKHGDNSLSRLKSTVFASMNKSEPNLMNSGSERPACDIPPKPRIVAPPKTLLPEPQLSSSSGKASRGDMMQEDISARNNHSGYHPSIRSIFHQTSKRISEFTSRLSGPSFPLQASHAPPPPLPNTLPPVLSSPEMVDGPQHSSIHPTPQVAPQVALLPLQRTSHHQEELPVISQPAPSEDDHQPSSKVKRSNARVHSPNFYQSLKSRWKPDSLPTEEPLSDIPAIPLFRDPSKRHSNFQKLILEQENQLRSATNPAPLADGQMAETLGGFLFPKLAPSRGPTERVEDCSEGKDAGAIGDCHRIGQPSSQPNLTASASVLVVASTLNRQSNLADPSLNPPEDKSCKSNFTASPMRVDFSAPTAKLPALPAVLTEPEQILVGCDGIESPSAKNQYPHLQECATQPSVNEPAISSSIPETESSLISQTFRLSTEVPSRSKAVGHIQAPASDFSESDHIAIAEGLHHKRHLTFAARRSSISMVLKRPESLNASTPVLFQGIWERELEENERKWKRLARMSGSQSSSHYSIESCPEKEVSFQRYSVRSSVVTGCPTRHSSSITAEHVTTKLGQNLSQHGADNHPKSQTQSDTLDQVWDSFKCDAELSLSDITCDDNLGSSGETSQPDLPDLHQITFDTDFDRVLAFQNSETPEPGSKSAKPIGLGLFHSCEPSVGSTSLAQEEYSPITNVKLKKLSLLANRTSLGSSGGSRDRRRRPERILTPNLTAANHVEENAGSLDLALLDAFPAPPRSHCSSQSPSPSHSLLKSTDPQRISQTDSTNAPASQGSQVAHDRPCIEHGDASSQSRCQPATRNSAKGLISFTLTSFSNRPRAQTSARTPVPPPLNLRATPSHNPTHRRRTMTSHLDNRGKSGPETAPPMPSLLVPNTAPLASTTPLSDDHDGIAVNAAALDTSRPSLPNETKISRGFTGGMTPKRPSLLIRPSLRSPHRIGVRMGQFRTGEASLSPKLNSPFSPGISSPPTQSCLHVIQPPLSSLHHVIEQTGCLSSPHASFGSSTGTASSSSTVPSPATPTSLRMTYNSRIPSVPMYNASGFSSGLKSPIKSTHSDNLRYVMINQTPKYSGGARATPDTIKASRIYKPEMLDSTPLSESSEQVSYGMAL